MKMPRTIWIARHGARADYVSGKWVTWPDRPHDPPLSGLGMRQAEEMARFLRQQDIQHIFVSPYLRTLQTIRPTARALGLPLKIELGLSECLWNNPAQPQFLSSDELCQHFPEVDASYRSWLPALAGPEAEEVAHQRGAMVAQALVELYDGNLLLLGHGVTVLGAVRGLTGSAESLQTSFAAISRVEYHHDGWRLAANGDLSHLSESTNQEQHVITL
jgi:broad specificity phosphatase PhoE